MGMLQEGFSLDFHSHEMDPRWIGPAQKFFLPQTTSGKSPSWYNLLFIYHILCILLHARDGIVRKAAVLTPIMEFDSKGGACPFHTD